MMKTLIAIALGVAGGSLLVPAVVFAQTQHIRNSSENGDNGALKRFRAFLEEDWKRWMMEYPEMATSVGFPGQNRRWSDDSAAGLAARIKHLHGSVAELKTISRAALPKAEQLNYDLYADLLATAEEGLQYGDDPLPFRNVVPQNNWMPINQMTGIQQGAAESIASMPRRSITDYDDILARLEALPATVEQQQAMLQEGLQRGYTPPKLMLRDVPKQIADLVPADPMASALLQPFKEIPAGIPDAGTITTDQPRTGNLHSSRGASLPKTARLHRVDLSAGLSRFDSRDGFAERGRSLCVSRPLADHYGSDAAADSRNRLVGSETHSRRDGQGHRVHRFQGQFSRLHRIFAQRSAILFRQADDLVNAYRIIAKRIDPELAHMFGKLPRLTYGVTPIPDFKAPSQTTAYYQPGAPSVGRPGLLLCEHLQSARAAEVGDGGVVAA